MVRAASSLVSDITSSLALGLRSESPSALVLASELSVAPSSCQEPPSSSRRSEERVENPDAPSALTSMDNGSSSTASRSTDEPRGPPPCLDASSRPNSQTSLCPNGTRALIPSRLVLRGRSVHRPPRSEERFRSRRNRTFARAARRTLGHRPRSKAQPLPSGSPRNPVEPTTDCWSVCCIPFLSFHPTPRSPRRSKEPPGKLKLVD